MGDVGGGRRCCRASPDRVVERLRPPSQFSAHPGLPRKTYPIALALTGRREEAVDFVREQQQEAADKKDAASRDYVAYADFFWRSTPESEGPYDGGSPGYCNDHAVGRVGCCRRTAGVGS